MKKNSQNDNIFVLKILSLIVYLIFLIKVILFKYPIDMVLEILKNNRPIPMYLKVNNANFVPFKSIMSYFSGDFTLRVVIANILGNIIIFIPLGIFIPIIFNKERLTTIVFYSFSLSLTFEVIQILTSLGTFDVDDIILNVLGSIIGYIIYRVFFK